MATPIPQLVGGGGLGGGAIGIGGFGGGGISGAGGTGGGGSIGIGPVEQSDVPSLQFLGAPPFPEFLPGEVIGQITAPGPAPINLQGGGKPPALIPGPQPQPIELPPIGLQGGGKPPALISPEPQPSGTTPRPLAFQTGGNRPLQIKPPQPGCKPPGCEPGPVPHLTLIDPPNLPDLDVLNPASTSERPAESTLGAKIPTLPCTSCQMSEEERAKLISELPGDSLEVAFKCPSAEDAEALAVGAPHKCVPL